MKAGQLFTQIFDKELKRRGYKRKGILYVRLVGEMLQGVTIKVLSPAPYELCFTSMPYWIFDPKCYDYQQMHKGIWLTNSASVRLCSPIMYLEEWKEKNRLCMEACFNLAMNEILPYIENVDTLEKFVNMQYISVEGVNVERRNRLIHAIRLHNIPYDGPNPFKIKGRDYYRAIDPEEAKKEVLFDVFGRGLSIPFDFIIRSIGNYGFYEQYAFLMQAREERNFQKYYDILEEEEGRNMGVYKEKMRENDFDWILQFKEEQKKLIIPKLREELGLSTFDL